MRDSTFNNKISVLKKKRAQAEKNVQKYTELREKWQKEMRSVDLEILEINSRYSKLSAEEMSEAIAMYKQTQANQSEQTKNEIPNQVNYGGIKNEH